MKDFEFRIDVPPPLVRYLFSVVNNKTGNSHLSVQREGSFSPHTQAIVVPTEALDAFCREWVKQRYGV